MNRDRQFSSQLVDGSAARRHLVATGSRFLRDGEMSIGNIDGGRPRDRFRVGGDAIPD